jgi:hypothetical protein
MYSIPRRANAYVRLVDPLSARYTGGWILATAAIVRAARLRSPFLENRHASLKVLLAWDAVMQGLTWPRLRGAKMPSKARTLPIKGRAARTSKGNGPPKEIAKPSPGSFSRESRA